MNIHHVCSICMCVCVPKMPVTIIDGVLLADRARTHPARARSRGAINLRRECTASSHKTNSQQRGGRPLDDSCQSACQHTARRFVIGLRPLFGLGRGARQSRVYKAGRWAHLVGLPLRGVIPPFLNCAFLPLFFFFHVFSCFIASSPR